MIATSTDKALVEFASGLSLDEVPGSARARLGLLLADMAAVCAAGRPAPASAMAAAYAAAVHPGAEATLLVDGRRVGAAGAAFANGVLANVLDFDDGHRLTKGHPGAVVIPATLAVAQKLNASVGAWLEAVVVGYEVAIRAGIALHDRDASYHASGAWGGVGAAVAARAAAGTGRLRDARRCRAGRVPRADRAHHALLRGAADDQGRVRLGRVGGASARPCWRRRGSPPAAEFLDSELDDLGRRWRLEELYIKAYPCCRWSQGAIAAAIQATGGRTLAPGDVRRVRVRTFAAADGLAKVIPGTTEEAQYSLVWPVACVLARGRFGVAEVLGPFNDPECPRHVRTGRDRGRRLAHGSVSAPPADRGGDRAGRWGALGGRTAPSGRRARRSRLPAVVASKVSDLLGPGQGPSVSLDERVGALAPDRLMGILRHAGAVRRWLRLTCRCRG